MNNRDIGPRPAATGREAETSFFIGPAHAQNNRSPQKFEPARRCGADVDRSSNSLPEPPEGWPDPLAEAAYHGLVGNVVRTIEPHTEADPAALLVQFLAAAGSCIGRGPHYPVEGDRHHANLFAVLVGNSAKARKGTSWGRIRSLYRMVDEHWSSRRVKSGLSSGEGLISAVRDATDTDPGEEDKRLLVVESEFSSALRIKKREGNTLSAIIRDAWDGAPLAAMTKKPDCIATDAHISILGHITRDELRDDMTAADAANGFSNRFLFIAARRSRYLPHGGALTDEALRPLAVRLAESIALAHKIDRVTMDPATARLWEEIYPDLSAAQPGLYGMLTARAEAQVVRLALIYALLDGSAEITPAHLSAALAVWDYAAASARHIFGDATGNPVADAILRALAAAPKGLSRTELSGALSRHASGAKIDNALTLLTHAKRVRSTCAPTAGRPVETWVLC